MARFERIWDQTAVNHGGAGMQGRLEYGTPGMNQQAVVNPYYYGSPNDVLSQVAAIEREKAISGRTPMEIAAVKQFAGAQIANMPPQVQQAIADQEYALASYTGGNGTPVAFDNPYTNQNLARDEQDAVATAIGMAQQTAAPGMGVPASPKVAAQVTAFLSGAEYRTDSQNQIIEQQLRSKYGAQLDSLPAWRQYSAESKQRFEETAMRSSEELLQTNPNLPRSVVSIDPKTGQAGIDPDRYRVFQDAEKQKLSENKLRIEQAKPLMEALQVVQTAEEGRGMFGSGSGAVTSSMQNAIMQARLADAATGGDHFSKSIVGSASATEAMTRVLQQLNQPKQPEQKTPPATGQMSAQPTTPNEMAGIADMAESRLLPATEQVILPDGRVLGVRATPFSTGQFSVPDQATTPKPNIQQSASQPKRGVFVHDVDFNGKQYAVPAEIKAVLEENPDMAANILPQFEKKQAPPLTTKRQQSGHRPGAPIPKPQIEWQGKNHTVSPAVEAAARKYPELTKYLVGEK